MRTIRDCNVCVVGGAGFLGSHLVNYLIEERHCRVLVIDNLVAGRREFVHPKAVFRHHDITESGHYLEYVFKEHEVQYVLNYASWPYIPNSFVEPERVFTVNANGAINVINAAQDAGVEGILQVSSAEIYGHAGYSHQTIDGQVVGVKIDEEGDISPHSTYGAAKAAVDYYCQTAWRERKTPVIALRQFNCVGERETHPYIVPEIISQLQQYKFGWPRCGCRVVIKLGNNSFRDFLYAGDAVRVAVDLLERGQWGEVYNLGSETGIKMYDLAKLIGRLLGFSDVKVEVDEARKRPWEIWHLQSDNRKLRNCLGERPSSLDFPSSLEEALKRTIAYYESNGRKWCWEK